MNKKRARVLDGEIEHLVDAVVAQPDRENMALEAATVTRVAFHFEIRHEMHLDRDGAGAAAFLASSAGDVERKMPRLHAQTARFGTGGEQLADVVVDFQVGRRIRSHRARRQFLPHMHHLADQLEAVDTVTFAALHRRIAGATHIVVVKNVLDQRRFS